MGLLADILLNLSFLSDAIAFLLLLSLVSLPVIRQTMLLNQSFPSQNNGLEFLSPSLSGIFPCFLFQCGVCGTESYGKKQEMTVRRQVVS